MHPALAFAAALIGGALGGILAAFLALPVAGVLQAVAGAYTKRYDVVETELTSESRPARSEGPGPIERVRDRMRKEGSDEDPADE